MDPAILVNAQRLTPSHKSPAFNKSLCNAVPRNFFSGGIASCLDLSNSELRVYGSGEYSMWSGVKCTILEDVWAHSTGGSRGEIAFWKLFACFGDLHSHQHLQSSASSASCNLSRPWCMRAASGNVLLPVDTTVWKDEGHPWCKPSSDLADPAGRSNHNWLLVSNIPRLPQRFCNNNLQQTTGLPMFFDGKNVSW